MTFLDAVIQGVVQGLTEFLPVSSSGHLLISQHILGVKENNLFFDVMLHIGTLLAVLAVYYKTVIRLIVAFFGILKDVFQKKFSLKNMNDDKKMVVALFFGLLPLFLLFIPVPGSGTNIKGVAENLAGSGSLTIVGIALVFTAIMLTLGIKRENKYKNSHFEDAETGKIKFFDGKHTLTILDALYVGVIQFVAAVFPGISRSGSTLSTALMRDVNKQTALDYSFILGIPAIVAAAALELKDSFEMGIINSINIAPVIVGMIVSAITGFLAIKLFKWLLKTNKMMIFVIYTSILGISCIIIGILERFKGINIFTGEII